MVEKKLRDYLALKQETETLKKSIERLEMELKGAKIPKMSGFPPGGARKQMDDSVIHLESLKERYARTLNKRTSEWIGIEKAINELENPVYRNLLRLRYLEGLSWEQVSVRMDYAWRQTHRLHKQAIEKLEHGTQ